MVAHLVKLAEPYDCFRPSLETDSSERFWCAGVAEGKDKKRLDFLHRGEILPKFTVRLDSSPPVADNTRAGWSSPVAREAHNLEVVGSNPAPATS